MRVSLVAYICVEPETDNYEWFIAQNNRVSQNYFWSFQNAFPLTYACKQYSTC